MTVYVDGAISATVGHITSRWSHLIADDCDKHAFAARQGLRREGFQDRLTTNTGIRAARRSRAAENCHYHLNAGKRMRAIQLGATSVTRRELAEIITRRYEQTRSAEARR